MGGRLALTLAAACLGSCLFATGAEAELSFAPGSPTIEVLSASGEPFTAAGGHPDRLQIGLELAGSAEGEDAKEIEFELPPGLGGAPGAVPVCPREVFESAVLTGEQCPSDTQVGIASVEFSYEGRVGVADEPLYNVEPEPGQLATFGSNRYFTSVRAVEVRPSDLAVTVGQRGIPREVEILTSRVELWGVPADHQSGTPAPRRPFLTLPGRCDGGPLALTARLRTWQRPERTLVATGTTGLSLSGCESLPFAPRFGLALSETRADSPSGADLEIALPQDETPQGRSSAAARDLEVIFPDDVSLSPGAASGLALCSDAAFGRERREAATCPAASQVGTVELQGAGLPEPLQGSLYLGEERDGQRFRLFVVAQGRGATVKLVGALVPDATTGALKAKLDPLPAAAFERIFLHFDGGPQSLLVTPVRCGGGAAIARLGRYDGAAAALLQAPAKVANGADGGVCPAEPPFAPEASVRPVRTRSGSPAKLYLTLRRRAGELPLERFTTVLPPGFSAAFGSLGRCSEQDLASGSCPTTARVGSAVAEVGSGSSTASLAGGVYVTGPYRGAPFGLATVFDAALGPFDFGPVLTRAALRVDAASGQVTAESDPLPTRVEGVALRFRSIQIGLDRSGLIRPPTSCGRRSMRTTVFSGVTAVRRQQAIRVQGCGRLRFSPRLALRFLGRGQVRPSGKPGLRIGIRMPDRGANLRGVEIRMPSSLRPWGGGEASICARQDALEGRCRESTWVGSATGRTPVVEGSLRGPLELVQPEGNGPPEIWASLDAGGARFDVRSQAFVSEGRLLMRLKGLPDVPLTQLVLKLDGGDRGLFVLGDRVCRGPAQASAELEAQNGKRQSLREPIEGPNCGDDG
jgi:hypothetical protein